MLCFAHIYCHSYFQKWLSSFKMKKQTWEVAIYLTEPLTGFCNTETENKFIFILVRFWKDDLGNFRSWMWWVQGGAEWNVGEQGGLQHGQWEGKPLLLEAQSEILCSPACPGYASNRLGHCSPGQKLRSFLCTNTHTHTHIFLHNYCTNKVSLRVRVSDFQKGGIIRRGTETSLVTLGLLQFYNSSVSMSAGWVWWTHNLKNIKINFYMWVLVSALPLTN